MLDNELEQRFEVFQIKNYEIVFLSFSCLKTSSDNLHTYTIIRQAARLVVTLFFLMMQKANGLGPKQISIMDSKYPLWIAKYPLWIAKYPLWIASVHYG